MKTRFLIVDDLPENRTLIRRLIESHFPDAVVDEADSGTSALEKAGKQTPDIVVLDVLMPDMDGYEACRQIKSGENTRSTLVLMISGHLTNTDARVSGLESGADCYICKPFETTELIAQLAALQRIRHTEKALLSEQLQLKEELAARKRMERQLETAKSAAEAAVRAKGEFLAHMSHEIRTPMNAVIGMTEILLDTDLTPEQREYMQTIHTAGETLLMVINDVLDFSKIESGRLSLEQRPFSLEELIDDAMSMVRAQAASKGLAVYARVDPATPGELIGDTIRLRQILANLLSNAVKFTEKGEIEVRAAACRLDRRECELLLSVRDTGIGIPAGKMSRLFESFSQLDDSMTRRYGGTGLGLAISKRLAELMNGGIWAESVEGRGSIFHVRVRLRFQRPAGAIAAADVSSTIAGRRVLILEDDADARERIVRQMRSWDIAVETSDSPEEAFRTLQSAPRPDLVLLGWRLTERAAFDFARRVRLDGGLRGLPLILTHSAKPGVAEDRPTAGAGTDGVLMFAARLLHPVDPSALFDALMAILGPKSPVAAENAAAAAETRILLAEDNPVNRKVAGHMLRRLGYRFDHAEDGRAALEAARARHYDLILMDVQMPRMDGVAAMRAIRSEYAGRPCPRFVALTAHAMQGDREKYLAAGMDDYISKPIREKELLRVLVKHAPPPRGPATATPQSTPPEDIAENEGNARDEASSDNRRPG